MLLSLQGEVQHLLQELLTTFQEHTSHEVGEKQKANENRKSVQDMLVAQAAARLAPQLAAEILATFWHALVRSSKMRWIQMIQKDIIRQISEVNDCACRFLTKQF